MGVKACISLGTYHEVCQVAFSPKRDGKDAERIEAALDGDRPPFVMAATIAEKLNRDRGREFDWVHHVHLADLPPTCKDRVCAADYGKLIGADPARMPYLGLSEFAEPHYCLYLALRAMAGVTAPPDAVALYDTLADPERPLEDMGRDAEDVTRYYRAMRNPSEFDAIRYA